MSKTVIKQYRESCGLTEQQLADLAYVSRDYIVKLEATMYARPSTNVIAVLADRCHVFSSEITIEYYREYDQKRLDFKALTVDYPKMDWHFQFGGYTFEVTGVDWNKSVLHPHVTFRQVIANCFGLPTSQIKWAQYSGIHPATLSKYELDKCRTMPKGIKEGLLNNIEVPLELVNNLSAVGEARYDYIHRNDLDD